MTEFLTTPGLVPDVYTPTIFSCAGGTFQFSNSAQTVAIDPVTFEITNFATPSEIPASAGGLQMAISVPLPLTIKTA